MADLWMAGMCGFHVGLRVSERWWCCVCLCHITWIHTLLSNGWEPDTCQSRHSCVARYRHTTAASFAPFPWHPARARSKHSLLPSGVSVQTSDYWTQQREFGRRECVSFPPFFFFGNRYRSDAKVWKPLSQQCSASGRVMESARRSCVTSVEGILTCGCKKASLSSDIHRHNLSKKSYSSAVSPLQQANSQYVQWS